MIAQLDKDYIRLKPTKVWARIIAYTLFEGRPITTRGRWINPVVFSLFKMWKNIPQIHSVDDPVFIVGTGRSGTTFLGKLLSLHRAFGFLNEPKALWHEIYDQEDIIGNYSTKKARYYLSGDDVSREDMITAHRLFGAFLRLSGSHRILDKYPELIFRFPYVRTIFPGAKFIFIIRNGYDTCSSVDKWSDRLGNKENDEIHDWWGVDDRKWKYLVDQVLPQYEGYFSSVEEIKNIKNHRDRAALEWILTMKEGMKLCEEYPSAILRVQYENLLERPGETINEILDFVNLKHDQSVFEYARIRIKKPTKKKRSKFDSRINSVFLKTMSQVGYDEKS